MTDSTADTSLPQIRHRSATNTAADQSTQPGTTCINYGSADGYARALRSWIAAYQWWSMSHSMAHFYAEQQMLAQYNSSNRIAPSMMVPNAAQMVQQQPAVVGAAGTLSGQRYIVASFARRMFAELIDFCVCFMLKLFIVYAFVELDLIDLERYDRLLSDKADLQTLIDVTQDLFPLEVLSKVISSLVEALYISYGFGTVPAGCTPGKFLMRIRVVSCDSVQLVPGQHSTVIIVGSARVPFRSSIIRSMMKNLMLSFLFPLCMLVYAFQHNRSVYDVSSSTIVVQI